MATLSNDLTLTLTNQEGLAHTLQIRTKDSETSSNSTPMDLTDTEFRSQIKLTRDINETPLANIAVSVVGPAANGNILLEVTEAVMETIEPGRYYYDLNIKVDGSEPDCLWIAPFVVEAGISKWQ